MDKIRHRAKKLGIEYTERMKKVELIRAIQAKEGKPACYDQQWCKLIEHRKCDWRHDCRAKLEPARGLVLSENIIVGHQVATLFSAAHGGRMRVVHRDKQAYAMILEGNIDVVVADIDAVDLGGLAVLAYSKHHYPSITTYAITQSGDLYLKTLARDVGGCQGFFYFVEGRSLALDTSTGLGAQLTRSARDSAEDTSRIANARYPSP